MFNHGKQVAVDGDKATCGNCEGAFPIVGGALRMMHHGRCVALEGDAVLCPNSGPCSPRRRPKPSRSWTPE
ncbi:PAAR domain-containing protein [Burkholderia sp. Bp8998]|uniref:PAAR domain-containing protein n=1 Tax=Burkholderia sp. Bp8998 TaxID=2184557 RepID=UPI0021AB98A4|nr:PAAR domain-containing protein [Burkholderia sp. Bp8998]